MFRAARRFATAIAIAFAVPAWTGPAAADGCVRAGFAVVLDIGHSEAAPGAISARGVPEHAFNLALAAEVLDALRRAGFAEARLLDPAGALPKLPARIERVRALWPALLLSIHHDSVQPHYLQAWTWQGTAQRYSDRFRGYSLFVSRRNGDFGESLAAATAIGEALRRAGFTPTLHHAEDIDGERRPLLDATRGVYAGDGLAILAHDGAPAVLIEAGVIVHRDEEREVASAPFRRRFAAALTAATAEICAAAGGEQR